MNAVKIPDPGGTAARRWDGNQTPRTLGVADFPS